MKTMKKRSRLWLLGLLAVGLGAVAAAQTFTESTQVVVVEVPVQVIRDGEPVRGLSAADFEVFDGRDKQTLTGFESVDLATLGGDAVATAELPASARRHFLVLFDLTFSSAKALVQARGAALDMVESLHPTDLVAVGTWSARRGPQLVLGFTADRRQIEVALDTLGASRAPRQRGAGPAPAGPGRGRRHQPWSSGGRDRPAGRKECRDAATADEILQAISRQTEEARAVELTRGGAGPDPLDGGIRPDHGRHPGAQARGLALRGVRPGAAPGRQTGGERSRPPGRRSLPWTAPPTGCTAIRASQNAVERMLEELRRADCVVQAVDIAGLRGQGDLGGAQGGGAGRAPQLRQGDRRRAVREDERSRGRHAADAAAHRRDLRAVVPAGEGGGPRDLPPACGWR